MTTSFNLSNIAEVELLYKSKVNPSDRPKISTSSDAYQILKQAWDPNSLELCEEFKILLLNRAHKILGIYNHSKGGVSGTIADPKLIFVTALKANASGVILAHNHPSGNLQPSQSDIDLTKKCKEAGKFLDIQILDHIILTTEKYYSMTDEGII
jgi:DNA repair protein RadC